MDSHELNLNIDYVGSCGIVLSPEQKATLETSLTILKHENNFTTVLFWGIIKGIRGDYFIAQGIDNDAIESRKTLYSKDGLVWCLLPVPGKDTIELSKYFMNRFTGDPSYEFEHIHKTQRIEEDEIIEEEEVFTIKEEDRLAAVIERMENDVHIVPRGAYLRLASGQVVRNKNFEGLTPTEASNLMSYFHFRQPIHPPHQPLPDRARLDKAVDFLDTIATDIPRGCWCIHFERGNSLVLVKSLLWLGYVLYHLPGTNKFGSIYVGTGEYNIDLPFML